MKQKSKEYKRDTARDRALRAVKMRMYPEMNLVIDAEVIDANEQKSGKDMVTHFVDNPNNTLHIDEKCATSDFAICRHLNTFCLELEFLLKNERYNTVKICNGWMINSEATTHYLFFYPRCEVDGGKVLSITEMECYLVPRQSIVDYYARKGFSMEELLQIYHDVPDSGKELKHGKKYLYVSNKDKDGKYHTLNHYPSGQMYKYSKIVESLNLEEKSITVLLPRNQIQRMAIAHAYRTYTNDEGAKLLALANSPTLIEKCNEKVLVQA